MRFFSRAGRMASARFRPQALALSAAFALAACGGGDGTTTTSTPESSTPPATNPQAPVALGNPTLSFVSPQESLELANYTLMARVTLPVDLSTGANQIAAEVSAVTYNESTDSLFIIGDEGTYITQLSKAGAVIDTMRLPTGLFGDPEGLTWAGGNQFVVANERERTANLVSYRGGTTLDASTVRSVKLGTTVGNIGLEGVTADPMTRGYIFVKETEPQGIFQTTLDFAAGTASNGSATTANPVNLFDPALAGLADIADVHALSNSLPSTAPDYSHLMLLSQESGRIVKVDRAGRIFGTLELPNAPLNLGHEGITFDKQLNMYVTNEAGGGSQALPQLWVYQPTRNSAQVGLGSNFYLTFPADVAAGAGNITLIGSNGDSRTIAVTDASQVNFNGKTVKIDPSVDLSPDTRYSIQYASGVIKDATGLATKAVGGTDALSFKTVADTTPPSLRSAVPQDNATGVMVGASIVLTFNETVQAGKGTFTLTNGSSDIRTIGAGDVSQVTVNGNTVTINPTLDLLAGTAYSLQASSDALHDLAGNAFAGIADTTTLNFVTFGTSPTPVAQLLITEVNTNAAGGDFFELYNYGTAAVNLLGWKWDDDSANFNDAASAAFPSVSIAPGQRLVVVAAASTTAFTTAWGLDPTTFPAVATGGPGLGKGDAVVLFDATGKVAAGINFGASAITAADGTSIAPVTASTGAATYAQHAGAVFGGDEKSSAVWDGVSTSAPKYRAAVVGTAGGFAQPAVASAIGSPGQ